MHLTPYTMCKILGMFPSPIVLRCRRKRICIEFFLQILDFRPQKILRERCVPDEAWVGKVYHHSLATENLGLQCPSHPRYSGLQNDV